MRAFGWRVGAGAAWPDARIGMSGTGHAGDGPDAIPDVPRHESATAGVERGIILTEAYARRECALAYRAMVDAVYTEAELDACPLAPATVKPRAASQRSGRISRQTKIVMVRCTAVMPML